MKKQIVRREIPDLSLANIPQPLVRIFLARGVQSPEEMELSLSKLQHFAQFHQIDKANALLYQALIHQEKVLIIGDFDADGATSTALAVRALRAFGFQQVNYLVPNRFAFGYGLTPEIVEVAHKEFQPDLIITVDNGIANFAGVEKAKQFNIKVLITDHHLPAENLPAADAIINPNVIGSATISRNLAGVGVIFYVMAALRQYLRQQEWFAKNQLPEPNMAQFLDLVALGTVADLVPLDQNNRILVKQGLDLIKKNKTVSGIQALLAAANRDIKKTTTSDLAFTVAPRLNAAGRLDDMSIGIECLITDDLARAQELANLLNQLNRERQSIELEMNETAFEKITANYSETPVAFCLYEKDWHQGVIGILASRVKEKFNRPVIAFAHASEHELKGSGRSIKGLHLRDALASLDQKHPGLMSKFGGHAMAAGLTLPLAHFAQFQEIFVATVNHLIAEEDLAHKILTDGVLLPEEINLTTAELLNNGFPWGQGFPEPLFDDVFEVTAQRVLNEKHLKLTLRKANQTYTALIFNTDVGSWLTQSIKKIHAVYKLNINEYMGSRKVELLVQYFEVCI